MSKAINISGLKFNMLRVIDQAASGKSGAMWNCVCDCGKKTTVNSLKIRSGKIKSCGCYRRENKPNLIHGLANKSKTYRTWKEMRQRCNNPNSTQFKWYGGRGITICKEWNSFEVFLSDMGHRPENKTIDRIDPDKGYSKVNCRWATLKEQATTNRGCFKKGHIPHNAFL